jgi:hypothetical protein
MPFNVNSFYESCTVLLIIFLVYNYQVQHIEHHSPVAPFRKGLALTEVFGNEEKENQVTCGRFDVGGGDPVIAKVPFDAFSIVLEGIFTTLPYFKDDVLC